MCTYNIPIQSNLDPPEVNLCERGFRRKTGIHTLSWLRCTQLAGLLVRERDAKSHLLGLQTDIICSVNNIRFDKKDSGKRGFYIDAFTP